MWPEWLQIVVAVGAGYAVSLGIGHKFVAWFHGWISGLVIGEVVAAAKRRGEELTYDKQAMTSGKSSRVTGFVERFIFTTLFIASAGAVACNRSIAFKIRCQVSQPRLVRTSDHSAAHVSPQMVGRSLFN